MNDQNVNWNRKETCPEKKHTERKSKRRRTLGNGWVFTGYAEEAIQNGLKTLDIPRMRAAITVISREKKAF